MKKIKIYLFSVLFLWVIIFQTGCYGSFQLTNKIYDFNLSLDNQVVKEIVFLVFVAGVYEISFFIDGLVLNTIEFWQGSNPMTMEDGESEIQIITAGNERIKVEATKNMFSFEPYYKKGNKVLMIYKPEKDAWLVKMGKQQD